MLTFARTVLGCHYEQAKRLVELAEDTDLNLDAYDFGEEEEGYTASLTATDTSLTGSLSGPVGNADDLMNMLGLNPEHYYVKRGHAGTWGSSRDGQKFTTKAEFELKEYDFYTDVDREGFIEQMSEFAPNWEVDPVTPGHTSNFMGGRHLLEIMVADLHADKYAEGYNLDEAESRFLDAITQIYIQTSAIGVPEEVLLVLNGDTFNWDHNHATTKGTKQDNSEVDGAMVFRRVREMVVQAVEYMARESRVRVLVMRGNHDYEKAAYLADTLHVWFRDHPNAEVKLMPNDREYVEWGVNLIGITHGDEVKPKDLPMVMMREADTFNKEVFEWHLGHIHTSKLDEYQGVQLRWFRTPADSGPWAERKGYGLNQKEITGIVWDDKFGKVAEFPYQFLNG